MSEKVEISDGDIEAAILAYCDASILSENHRFLSLVGMKAALARFVELHPELAPQRAMHEPVVVTEEMRDQFMMGNGWSGWGCSRAILEAMNWLADRINEKSEKPADPRVAALVEAMDEMGLGLLSDRRLEDRARKLLAKLDEVKP